MPVPHNIARIVVLIIVILYLLAVMFAASRVGDKIPEAIKKRLDELKIRVLDDQYTPRDLAFHRFARPDYLGELKKINAERKDAILTKYLESRRNLLVFLAISFAFVAAIVILYFYTIKR